MVTGNDVANYSNSKDVYTYSSCSHTTSESRNAQALLDLRSGKEPTSRAGKKPTSRSISPPKKDEGQSRKPEPVKIQYQSVIQPDGSFRKIRIYKTDNQSKKKQKLAGSSKPIKKREKELTKQKGKRRLTEMKDPNVQKPDHNKKLFRRSTRERRQCLDRYAHLYLRVDF